MDLRVLPVISTRGSYNLGAPFEGFLGDTSSSLGFEVRDSGYKM